MESSTPQVSSTSGNFSYPNHQKPEPGKLRWSKTISQEPDDAYNPGAVSPRAGPRPHRGSSSSPERHWIDNENQLRKVSDTVTSGVRSFGGSIRSLGRRLVTPPAGHAPHPGPPPSSRRLSPPPRPAPARRTIVSPGPLSGPNKTPVLCEYMAACDEPAHMRGRARSGGVVYLSTDPLDSRETFIIRARTIAVGGDDGLFDINIGPRGAFLDFWVCWNQGSDGDHVGSRILGDEEFKRAVELMAVRGWKDTFLLSHRSPPRN